jgi:hypothetical protein
MPDPAILDPALFALPEDKDDDFPPPHLILMKVAKPAVKTAGSRRCSSTDVKGKNKALTPGPSKGIKCGPALSSEEPEPKKRRGRAAGVVNYSNEDVDALLDIIEENLPTGGKGWNTVGSKFVVWAEENGRPARTAKSLEAKYKQVCDCHLFNVLANESLSILSSSRLQNQLVMVNVPLTLSAHTASRILSMRKLAHEILMTRRLQMWMQLTMM